MPFLSRTLLAATTTLLLTAALSAQEPIRFARTPDISPDGKLVAFSYLGDIWVVETIGGVARPVTLHQAHDVGPVFSPDGKWIAFSSKRHGSYDVFVAPAHGGRPRRLTFDSAPDQVCDWSPDGKSILFTSGRGTDYPGGPELYTVPVDGGRVRRVTGAGGKDGVFSPRGDQIAYTRGVGLWYRKGYRGSSNDEIWLCDADGRNNRLVTEFNGQDTSPMWGPDGRALCYVSDFHGTPANIVRQSIGDKTPPQQLTFHKVEGVRQARLSKNGEYIVYECGPDLFVVGTGEGQTPRRLAVEVQADDKVNPETVQTFTQGATEFVLDAEDKNIAFVVHGEIFMMPLGKDRAVRLTDSPAYDHGVAWAPDSSKIVFLSDRDGHEDLYLLESNDPDHPKFVEARSFKAKPLTRSPEAEMGVSFSPDGKRIAFLRAGQLWTMGPDGFDLKALVKDVQVVDYEWSPDSKWLVYARMDGSFASELYIVPATGPSAADPPRNVTRYATFNAGVTWSKTGNKLAFLSSRRQVDGLYVLALQKPAAEGAPATKEIDWDDIHRRVQPAAPVPALEGVISPDGSKVAFSAPTGEGKDVDLWLSTSSGGQFGTQLTRVTTGNLRPTQIRWSTRFTDVLFFRDGSGQLRMVKLPGRDLASLLGGGSASKPPEAVPVPFKVKFAVRQEEEFREMLEQSWRALAEQFYDARFHGIDWYAVRARYRPLVRHCVLKEDLYALISLMLGELNASHLGIAGPTATPTERTADLGLVFDKSYAGPGMKIAEILKHGPADRRGLNLKPGDVVLSLDGTELNDKANLSQLLTGKTGETVALQVTTNPADPKAKKRVEVQAGDRAAIPKLMYERWVDRNARRVAELSQGKLGYIHIPSMDEAGLDQFVRSLYSDNFDKEAIVLDVRYNGGGFTHDQLLNYLGGKEHAVFRHRFGGQGLVLRPTDRKWTRPLVLLINNRSFSDAEIFPNAFRTFGLGKLVGLPTGGFVIGTAEVKLIDDSSFRIPRLGVFTAGGVNMEQSGVQPDVLVAEHPDQLAQGLDVQLDKAVEVLRQDVTAWKSKQGGTAQKPTEGGASGLTPPSGSK